MLASAAAFLISANAVISAGWTRVELIWKVSSARAVWMP